MSPTIYNKHKYVHFIYLRECTLNILGMLHVNTGDTSSGKANFCSAVHLLSRRTLQTDPQAPDLLIE